MKIAVVGTRSFKDYECFKEVMDEFLQNFDNVEFISGGAEGADSLALRYAKEKGLAIKIFFPDWKRYHRGAGKERNKQIWKEADMGIAFWNAKSRGTAHSLKLAQKLNKTLWIYDYTQNKLYKYER